MRSNTVVMADVPREVDDDECPTCGKELSSPRGVKIHHSQTHGESLVKNQYTCDCCGKEFTRHQSMVEGNSGVYCSPSCGAKAPSFDPGYRELKNKYHYEGKSNYDLADEYGVIAHTVRRARERYGIESRKGYGYPELHLPRYLEYMYNDRELSVQSLADEIGCEGSSVRAAMEKYGIDRRGFGEGNRGEKHPDWKGGVPSTSEYGIKWKEQRQKALERDGYECRACGMGMEKHKELYNKELEIHHVVPVRKFNQPEDAHSLGNLVTACMSCHREYEGMPVFPSHA